LRVDTTNVSYQRLISTQSNISQHWLYFRVLALSRYYIYHTINFSSVDWLLNGEVLEFLHFSLYFTVKLIIKFIKFYFWW